MPYNKFVDRTLIEKLIGKRKYRKYFGESEVVSIVYAINVLRNEGTKYLSARMLSKLLGVTTVTLRNWLKQGKIKAIRRNRYWFYDLDSVLDFISNR